MATAMHACAIIVMACCFTTGFGLRCHVCETDEITYLDKCYKGDTGFETECFEEIFKNRYPNDFTDAELIAEKKIEWEGSYVCLLLRYLNYKGKVNHVRRLCNVNDTEGMCDTYQEENKRENAKHKTSFTLKCKLCSEDLCNCDIGLTPTFLMYPFLLLLPINCLITSYF